MSGEMDDCVSSQAEHLPTGSISFGRFEVESLSWEKRSSFSHNRYLEEVEKYSTPGSVTQKRAILEAHFKKKASLLQASSENQNEAESPTTKNDIDHHTGCLQESVVRDNGGQPEFAWYDETPTVSDEHEVMDCQQEEISSEFQLELAHRSDEGIGEDIADVLVQPQPQYDTMESDKHNLCEVIEDEPDNKSVIVEELFEKSSTSSKSPPVEKKNTPRLKKTQKVTLKVKETVEQRTAKTKLTNEIPVHKSLTKSSAERSSVSSCKMLSKPVGKVDRENAQKMKSVKQLPVRAPASPSSDIKHLKAPENLKAKVRQDNRRPKMTVHSTKEEARQSGAVFSFKSDERAEKRREYYMKLEEKLHAKEAEMNEIQAKTQQKTEAEMKQFRRSLNFKATPMPSFYHEPEAKVSERKKVATQAKSQKLHSKCTSPGSHTSREKSPAFSMASNSESPSTDEFNQVSEAAMKSEARRKEERNKLIVQQQQQRRGSEKKLESVNRMRGGMVRKAMKGGGISGSVAVHVAS